MTEIFFFFFKFEVVRTEISSLCNDQRMWEVAQNNFDNMDSARSCGAIQIEFYTNLVRNH